MSFSELNTDCLTLILDQLGLQELAQLAQTNRRCHQLVVRQEGYRLVREAMSKLNCDQGSD